MFKLRKYCQDKPGDFLLCMKLYRQGVIEVARALIATILLNTKGKEVYCQSKKISDKTISIIRSMSRDELEAIGFTFIPLISPDYPNIRGYAIFFEGHLDELARVL